MDVDGCQCMALFSVHVWLNVIVNQWLFEHILLNRSEGNKNVEVIIKSTVLFLLVHVYD